MQLILFEPQSDWNPPSLSDLPDWNRFARVSLDLETRDPKLGDLGPGAIRRDGYPCGYGFTCEGDDRSRYSFYLPIRHLAGGNLPEANVLRYMRDQAARFSGDLIGANLMYDLIWSWYDEILFQQVKRYIDVQVVEPLIDELPMSMGLDAIAARRKVPGKNEELLRRAAEAHGLDPKKDLWKLHAKYVGDYCAQDTVVPLDVWHSQEQDISGFKLWDVFNLECEVLPILLKQLIRGTRIDQDKLSRISEWATGEEQRALEAVRKATGVIIPLDGCWKKKAIAPVLQARGINIPLIRDKRTKKLSFKIDKALLESHSSDPAIAELSRAREVNKLTGFARSVKSYMVNGRIHPNIKQIAMEDDEGDEKGARYGRMSCVHPNIQQQPSKGDFAQEWRSIYLPEEYAAWACNDFSQQEPRWTTHFAAQAGLDGAKEAAEAYWADPYIDNHQFMADLTGLKRSYAKNIYLGLCYGEGGYKLCVTLGLPTAWRVMIVESWESHTFETEWEAKGFARASRKECRIFPCAGPEGQAILDTFDQRAPFIRQLAKLAQKRAKRRGWIRTAGGRVLHFPQKDDGSYDWIHKALNRLIQGTSGDQLKKALIAVNRDFPNIPIHFPVHDEVNCSVESVKQALMIARSMRECMQAGVPFRVDVELGLNWGYIYKPYWVEMREAA